MTIFSYSQNTTLVTENDMFYIVLYSTSQDFPTHLRFYQKSLKTLMMLYFTYCEFSSNTTAMMTHTVILKVKEGIWRVLRHRIPLKDCSNVKNPQNFQREFSRIPLCILSESEVSSVLHTMQKHSYPLWFHLYLLKCYVRSTH